MFNRSRFSILMVIVAAIAILACGACSSPRSFTEQPTPALSTTPLPTPAPTDSASNAKTAIPCAQLFPPDDIKLLLDSDHPVLQETTGAAESTCTWQYTPRGGSQPHAFELQAAVGSAAQQAWAASRKAKLARETTEPVVISIDGLGDENYTWVSQPGGNRVVFVRKGSQTLSLEFAPDVLFLQSESGIIDTADRIFERIQ